jgi:intein-encoded DNA endonuclease-like protein
MSRVTEKEKAEIINLYKEGQGSNSIAKQFERTPTCILKILKKAGVPRRSPKRKISLDKTEDICQLYRDGESASKIAKKFDVTNTVILRILKKNNIDRRNASECHRIYPINENFFDTIDTEEKAYFLGFLYADGGNIKSGNFVRIELQEQDEDILHKLAKLIYKEEPEKHVRTSIRLRDLGNGEKEYRSKYLNINSKHVCETLEKHGCMPAKTFKIKFPEWLPEELQRHFIRGYFDGDGKVFVNHKKGKSSGFNIASTKDMVEKMSNIVNSAAKSNLSIYFNKIWITCCSGDKQIARILNWMYNDSTIYLNRKYNSYQQIKNRKRAR